VLRSEAKPKRADKARSAVLTSWRAKRGVERYALDGAPAVAFCTLKPFRQEVQTHSRRTVGPSWMRTFWRLGFLRRRVALSEWLRALPKSGFFPQE